MAEAQPRLHPILDVVAKNAVPGEKEGTVDFDEAGLKTIQSALERLLDKPDLPHAVMAVVAFAAHLDRDVGSPEGGRKLLDVTMIASDAIRERAAKAPAVPQSPEDEAQSKAKALANFMGERRRLAPTEQPSESSVKATKMFRPQRISGR